MTSPDDPAQSPGGPFPEASDSLRARVQAAIPTHAFIIPNARSEGGAYDLDEITDRIMAAIGEGMITSEKVMSGNQIARWYEDHPEAIVPAEDTGLMPESIPLLRSATVRIDELQVDPSRLPYCRAWKADGDQCGYRGRFAQDGVPICGLHLGKRDTLFIPDKLRRR